MSDSIDFYKWFDSISKKLEDREISFRKIFKYLDSQPTPIIIVETGCLRVKDNFLDGQSTLLFDKYTLSRGEGSKVYTVDINKSSTDICKQMVSENVEITTDDSVRYLNGLCSQFLKNRTKVTMFYLDSIDVNWRYPYPSAAHHLKELVVINRVLLPTTLLVVDDSPATGNLTLTEDLNVKNWKVLGLPSPPPTIGGKGYLVHEFASHVKANLLFSHYQAAWFGFNKE